MLFGDNSCKFVNKQFLQKFFPALLLVAGLVFGYIFGFKKGEEKINLKTAPLLNEARKYFQPIPEFNSLSGRVLEIKDNKIILEAAGLPRNPFESVPTRRVIGFDDSTRVVKIVNKNSAGYEKEVEEYQKRLKASAGESVNVKPPSLTEEAPILISEIGAGDTILVEAQSSIKTKDSFEAVKIIFQSRADSSNSSNQL